MVYDTCLVMKIFTIGLPAECVFKGSLVCVTILSSVFVVGSLFLLLASPLGPPVGPLPLVAGALLGLRGLGRHLHGLSYL